jgi:SWI/SNF-related matrix-associated actin-dependent regulator 1 of chromatin subfamily A
MVAASSPSGFADGSRVSSSGGGINIAGIFARAVFLPQWEKLRWVPKFRADGRAMVIYRIDGAGFYVCRPKFHQSHLVKTAGGWWWKHEWKQWVTRNPVAVENLRKATGWGLVDFEGRPQDAGKVDGALDAGKLDLDGHPSAAVSSEYSPPSPAGLSYLPFQRAGVEYALGKEHVLIADEMGLGKTIQALGVVAALGEAAGNVLVVCPAALKLNWRDEALKWLPGVPVGVLGQKEPLPKSGLFVVNYDQLQKWQDFTHGRLWDVLILDEAHFLGNAKSIRTRLCLGDAFGRGAIPAQKLVALTGTPISNRVEEIFPLLRRMLPERFRFFAEFEDRYGSGQNLGELQMLLRDKVMVRRMKADVLKDLPEKWVRRIEIPCDHEPAIEATAVYRQARARYAEMMRDPAGANTRERAFALETAQRAMQEAQAVAMRETKNAKTAAAVDFVAEAIEEARGSGRAKVVAFVWHATMAAALLHRFGSRAVAVTGEDSDPHRRREAVERFQKDPKVELFVGNLKAAGAGLTLTAANREIMVELHWNPALLAQAEDRCIAAGQPVYCVSGGMAGIKVIEDVKTGDFVMSHKGTMKLVTATGKKTWVDGRMARIEYVGSCEPLECTHDHRLLVVPKGEFEPRWVEARNVCACDSLVMPRPQEGDTLEAVLIRDEWRIYQSGEKANPRYVRLPDFVAIDDEWIFVFGWYAAEGFASVSGGKGRFLSFSGHKKEIGNLERIQRLFARYGVKGSIYAAKDGDGIELRVYSAELAFWFRDWFGQGEKGKRLPAEIMGMSRRQTKLFLDTYVEGDGYSRNKGHEWVSASKTLALQVCILAAKCGYAPCLNRSSEASGPHWVGSYRENTLSDLPFLLRKVRSNNLHWQRRPKVYDLTVEGDESFMVGLASVHNCHRIGQERGVVCDYLVCAGTIDEDIMRKIERKKKEAGAALNRG